MGVMYRTTVVAVGGRSGTVRSDDGVLDLPLTLPKALGGKGDATNPEQLFAAGYAACLGNAVIHVSRSMDAKIRDQDVEVEASVGMSQAEQGGFVLSVEMDVAITGIDQETAEKVVAAAHAACPYSNAVRGNIDVVIVVKAY